MPGMMRSRKTGCMCLDCDGPRMPDRASERRDWRRLEADQAAPCSPWPRSSSDFVEPDDVQFGYWSVVQDQDGFLNEQARPYLADAMKESS